MRRGGFGALWIAEMPLPGGCIDVARFLMLAQNGFADGEYAWRAIAACELPPAPIARIGRRS
jgi:hypothetical protein